MVCKFLKKLARDRKGQGIVEYSILVAGVALVSLVAVSVLGHKTTDMLGTVAAILPGSQVLDNEPIVAGTLIEENLAAGTPITLAGSTVKTNDAGALDRLGNNTGIDFQGSADLGLTVIPQ